MIHEPISTKDEKEFFLSAVKAVEQNVSFAIEWLTLKAYFLLMIVLLLYCQAPFEARFVDLSNNWHFYQGCHLAFLKAKSAQFGLF